MSLPEAPDNETETETNTLAPEDADSSSQPTTEASDAATVGATATDIAQPAEEAAIQPASAPETDGAPENQGAPETAEANATAGAATDANAEAKDEAEAKDDAEAKDGVEAKDDAEAKDGVEAKDDAEAKDGVEATATADDAKDEPTQAETAAAAAPVVSTADIGTRLEELATEAEGLANADNAQQAVQRWSSIQSERDQLVARDDAEPLSDALAGRFTVAGEALDGVQQRAEKQARDKLNALASQLEEMVGAEELVLRKAERKLRDAQDFLKEPPDAVLPNKEWAEFKTRLESAREALMPKVRELEQLEEWKRWANVPVQEQLCEKVEALLERDDYPKMARELREAQAEWKKVAAAPREKSEILWRRFKTAGDKVRERSKAYFAEQDKVRQENLKKKVELCEKAEQLQDSTEWRETANDLKQLQAEWKAIGPVPRKQSDAIWKRFRKACDNFFERRKEHLGDLHKDREDNLKAKIALCEKAEAMQNSTDWSKGTDAFKQMQRQWKEIGPVPRKHSDVVWRRFRAACDRFFDRRSRKDEIHLDDNLVVREDVVSELESLLPAAREAAAKKEAEAARREAAKKAKEEAKAAEEAKKAEEAKAAEEAKKAAEAQAEADTAAGTEEAAASADEGATAEAAPAEAAPADEAETGDEAVVEATTGEPEAEPKSEELEAADTPAAAEQSSQEPAKQETAPEAPKELGPPENLAETVRKAQQTWDQAGQMPSGKATAVVEERYRKVRTALMEAYADHLEGTDLEPQAIEDRREKIVERLETLVEKRREAQESAKEKEPSLADLAAQIKAAMASNTIRRGGGNDSAARSADEREAQRIETSWRQIPGTASQEMIQRYKKAKSDFQETLTS